MPESAVQDTSRPVLRTVSVSPVTWPGFVVTAAAVASRLAVVQALSLYALNTTALAVGRPVALAVLPKFTGVQTAAVQSPL